MCTCITGCIFEVLSTTVIVQRTVLATQLSSPSGFSESSLLMTTISHCLGNSGHFSCLLLENSKNAGTLACSGTWVVLTTRIKDFKVFVRVLEDFFTSGLAALGSGGGCTVTDVTQLHLIGSGATAQLITAGCQGRSGEIGGISKDSATLAFCLLGVKRVVTACQVVGYIAIGSLEVIGTAGRVSRVSCTVNHTQCVGLVGIHETTLGHAFVVSQALGDDLFTTLGLVRHNGI